MFHQGIQTRENMMKTRARSASVFIVFECLGPLMKHDKRVVYMASQSNTNLIGCLLKTI